MASSVALVSGHWFHRPWRQSESMKFRDGVGCRALPLLEVLVCIDVFSLNRESKCSKPLDLFLVCSG